MRTDRPGCERIQPAGFRSRQACVRAALGDLMVVASLMVAVTGCSVAMALHGHPEPNFQAFEIGSSRQIVEVQLGHPVASQTLEQGKKKDVYQYEIGNSPNGHRALLNFYFDLATIGLWEIPGTIIEAMMGHREETRVIYNADDRVGTIEGYTTPQPTGALKDAIEAQEQARPSAAPK